MADLTLTDEDRAAIRAILIAERDAGNPHPVLPADVDLDGDGLVDGYTLTADGTVITILSAPIADSMYEATGEDGN